MIRVKAGSMPIDQEVAIETAAFIVSVAIALLSAYWWRLFHEGLFGRITGLTALTGVPFAFHATSEIFFPGPYGDLLYAATGAGAAVAMLLTIVTISHFLDRAIEGQGVPERR